MLDNPISSRQGSSPAVTAPADMLTRLVEQAPVGMSIHDADGRCLVINEELTRINGVSIDDSLGRTVEEYLPTLASQLRPLFDRVRATGVEVRTEVHGEAPATPGRIGWWQVTCRPIDVDDGAGVAVVVEEITDQKKAIEALSTSERELRSVFDSIDQGFCICEMITDESGVPIDYRFVHVNPLFEEMTGLSEAAGRTALELVPDLEHHWIEVYGRVALGGETVRFEQGSEAMGRWFDVFATPLATSGRFAIVFRDETARRAADAAEAQVAERYRAMADDLPLIVWMHGPDGDIEFVNDTYCGFFGVQRDAIVGGDWRLPVHPDDLGRHQDAFRRALSGSEDFHELTRVRDGHGQWRWLESWGTPRFTGDGDFVGHLGASADVTERIVAEEALAEAGQFMTRVLDSLFSFVGVLDPDGTVVQANRAPLDVAGLTIDDVRGEKFWNCFWWNYDETISTDVRRAVEQAAAGTEVRFDVPVRVAGDERLWIDFQIVPLRSSDGTITHLVPSGLDISERIRSADERARLLAEERRRRRRAEALEEHAAAIASAVDPDELAVVTVEHVEQLANVDMAAIHLRHDDIVEIVTGPPVRSGDAGRSIALDDALPGPAAILTNQVVRCNSREEILSRFHHLDDKELRDGLESLVALPLRAAGRSAVGALVVGSSQPDAFHASTLSLLHGLAEQTGLGLERARVYERVRAIHRREHEIAVQLQRSLLPDRLVKHPALTIAARYHAADEQLEVGGDWYDSFEWPSGEIGVIVGDVAGHDLTAAAAMGRLRSAVAALVPTLDPDPTAVLGAVQRIALGPDGTPYVTAVCAVVDPLTGTLQVATAGHPPPLLVRGDTAEWLAAEPSPPLGSLDVTFADPARFDLEPGDCVVLYSDGVVERRHEPIDEGLDRLRAVCAVSTTADLDRLLEELTGDGAEDDNVVVALTWQPDGR